jgi:2-polyprenyl-3-methyl-5-hydroxy-6-metoxy-1,4-benzoquinol methylase
MFAHGSNGAVRYREEFYSGYATATGKTTLTREYFETCAHQYEGRWAEHLPRELHAKILDLACGNGEFLYFLQRRGFTNVEGIDLCAASIENAQSIGITTARCGDLFEQPLPPCHYDVIAAFNLVEHLTKDEVLLFVRRIHAALKPGGAAWIVTPNGLSPFGSATRYWDFSHETSFTPSAWRQLARLVGFNARFEEWGPIRHSTLGCVRWVLWKGLCLLVDAWSLIEVGGPRDIARVYTADMKVILIKEH